MNTSDPHPTDEKPRLRWYQYSLRSLLLATTLLCGLLSLFAWQVKRAAWQSRCVQAIRDRGGWVDYDYCFVNGKHDPQAKSRIPEWLRRRLGDDFFHRVA